MNLPGGRNKMTIKTDGTSENEMKLIKKKMSQEIDKKIALSNIGRDVNKKLTSKSRVVQLRSESVYLL